MTWRNRAARERVSPAAKNRGKETTDTALPSVHAPGDRSIAIGESLVGVASSGDNALNVVVNGGQIFLPAVQPVVSPTDVEPPAHVYNVPSPPPRLVGRAAAVNQLDSLVDQPSGAAVQVVHGLGGIGKSSLVASWAKTQASVSNPVWWIAADSAESIAAGLSAMAAALCPGAVGLSLPDAAQWATQWLSAHRGWLLILDNVNDRRDISALLARLTGGRILITTRRATGWSSLAAATRLDALDDEDAVDMLDGILNHSGKRQDGGPDGAAELCTELGCLPLAIEQAGAYIAETGITPRAYLDSLSQYPAVMFENAATDSDSERTIARIWRLTLDKLAEEPGPVDLLRVVAFYAPDSIPRTIFHALVDPLALDRAIGRLNAYSMVTVNADDGTFRVHRLVQTVSRTPDPKDPHRHPAAINLARIRATQALDCALLDDYDDPNSWEAWRIVARHAEVLIRNSPPETDIDHTARLLNQLALFRSEHGDRAGAASYCERAYASACRLEGADSVQATQAMNNLASVYTEMGKPSEAVPLAEQAVVALRAALGDEHPETLASCGILAEAHRAAGNLAKAIGLREQILEVSCQVLGDADLDTVRARNRLAGALQEAGETSRAVQLHKQNLAIFTGSPQARHPLGITLRGNLAFAYKAVGRIDEAIQLFEEALSDAISTLGANHPQTLALRNNLARAYQASGDAVRAVDKFEELLEDYRHVFGEDDPETLSVRDNLADAYLVAGRPGEAVRRFEQLMVDRTRALTDDHPDTLMTRTSLANALFKAGEAARAIALLQEAESEYRRVFGGDHTLTRWAANNLARARRRAPDQ